MSVKTTGAEFKRYYNDPVAWPHGQWYYDSIIEVNHVAVMVPNAIDDYASVVIRSGYVWSANNGDVGSLESHFKKWRKSQQTCILAIECPKEKLESMRAMVTKSGGRCVG